MHVVQHKAYDTLKKNRSCHHSVVNSIVIDVLIFYDA